MSVAMFVLMFDFREGVNPSRVGTGMGLAGAGRLICRIAGWPI